jgi:hypothetical protein
MNLLNFDNALRHFKQRMYIAKMSFRDLAIEANKQRYRYLEIDNYPYLVCFKKELFLSYGKIYNESGAGETINQLELRQALSNHIKGIIYLYPEGNSYLLRAGALLEMIAMGTAHLRETGNEHKMEYCFSIRKLERFV